MAHAQKQDFVVWRNRRVHLNRRGRQLSRLLATEACASAVVMPDAPCSEVVWKVLATHSIRQFCPSLPLPCVTVCHHISTGLYNCPKQIVFFHAAMFKMFFKSSGRIYCVHPSTTLEVSQEAKPVKILMDVVPSTKSVKPRPVQGGRKVSTERVSIRTWIPRRRYGKTKPM